MKRPMGLSLNVPYVKKYDTKGEVSNPITKEKPYVNEFENRKQRREHLNQPDFRGNTKGVSLTVNREAKFYRFIQQLVDKKTGKRKSILHYIPA